MFRKHIARVAIMAAMLALAPAILAVPARAGGGGFCRGTPVTDARGVRVDIKDFCFTPTVLHIQPGQSVTWTNADAESHVVAGANIAWGTYEDIVQGMSVTFKFVRDGVYPYYCFIHPGMVGAVVVGDGSGRGSAKGSTTESAVLASAPTDTTSGGTAPKVPLRPVVVVRSAPWVWSTAALAVLVLLTVIAAALALRRRVAPRATT